MASKRYVFQVAKEFNVSTEALISYLMKLNYSVKTHMSPVTEEMYDEISKKYNRDVTASDADHDFRKRLKEKKIEEERRRERARRELDQHIQVAREIAKRPIKKKEPSKEEVLKIAAMEAKAEAQAELRDKGRPVARGSRRDEQHVEAARVTHEMPKAAGKKAGETQPEEIHAKGVPGEGAVPIKPVEAETTAAGTAGSTAQAGDKTASTEKSKRKRTRRKKKPQEGAEAAKPVEAAKRTTEPETDKKKRRKRKKKKRKISEEEIEASIKQTLAAIGDTGKPKRRRRRVKAGEGEEIFEDDGRNIITVTEFISAADLAKLMDVESTDVLKKCLELGLMVTINQRLDMDTIITVADEFGFDVEQEEEFAADLVEEEDEDREEDLQPRPPVVTIMGHVDHGKTSLLDYIRRSNIIAGEAGGITQHIGAYEVTVNGRNITFLDTPGHEAFTAMRARGAQITDIVILIVAADDGVQQQTVEAINHARAAGVPIVVAINKIDRPGIDVENIKQQLAQHDLLVESWGGKYQSVEISAKTGQGVDKVLEAILLEAELLELRANPNKPARGVVVEAELDRGKGAVATVLIQSGTLKVADAYVAGLAYGRVRAMLDERGGTIKEAPPSTPVRVIGFTAVPQAGDRFAVLKSEKEAREIAQKRQQIHREQELRKVRLRTLDQIAKQIKEGAVRELQVIVKGDVDGSVEAIADSLMKLSTPEVAVDVIHKGVGGISETDVNLAAASDAIILGFQVRVSLKAREMAELENVDIRTYKVIYDAVDEVKAALEGLLKPEIREEVIGSAEVREIFKVPKAGTIAGCYVQSGTMKRNSPIRLYREDKLIYESQLSSLKRFKDDAREVASGFECGIGIENFDDIHVGDIIECIELKEYKRTL